MEARALSPLHRQIGAAIRECRTAFGLTRAALAARADLDVDYVGKVERGTQNINVFTLGLFIAALNAKPREVPPLSAPAPIPRPAGLALLQTFAKGLGLSRSLVHSQIGTKPGSSRIYEKAHDEAHDHVNPSERRILEACLTSARSASDIRKSLGFTTRTGNFKKGMNRLIRMELLEVSIPQRPRSKHQKYRLTDKGRAFLANTR